MDEKQALIFLNLINGIGPLIMQRLIKYFGCAGAVLNASRNQLMFIDGIGKEIAEIIVSASIRQRFDRELELIEKNNIQVVSWDEAEYPVLLKEIPDPPPILYVLGKLPEYLDVSIAVVGSRRTSLYGMNFAKKISTDLVKQGFTVVSGLARGIDTSAHKGAIQAGGSTVAVLGSGLLNIFPPENKKLSTEIIKVHGAVISEFPLTFEPLRGNFPRRNRIISGLSRGVIVVEAARRSGSLITARLALEQNRELFAMPGLPGVVTSMGTNDLIKQGAKLITGIEDVIEDMGCLLKDRLSVICKTDEKSGTASKNISLTDNEKNICKELADKSMSLNQLAVATAILEKDLSLIVLNLQLKGLIKKLPGGLYMC